MLIDEIKDYLAIPRRHRNGIIVLMACLIVVLFIPNIYLLFKADNNYDYSEFENDLLGFEKSLEKTKTPYLNRLDKYIIERYDSLNLFKFNPNNVTDKQWNKLGLTDKQIKTINRYRERGGTFYDKNDFKKIYGIRMKQYEILKPYIDLPEKSNYSKNYYSENKYNKENIVNKIDSLFKFDPNKTTEHEWKQLGFSEKQIKTLKNYTSKGGRFFKKEDLKKIHTVSEKHYNILEPYIRIEKTEKQIQDSIARNIVVDINKSNEKELTKIKGINEYIAQKIVYYRSKLGGYNSKKQLLEIKNFKKETFNKIERQLIIQNKKVLKLSINFLEAYELAKHPYLNLYQSKSIVEYRINNGSYTSVKQLIDNKILPKHVYIKAKNYLTIN